MYLFRRHNDQGDDLPFTFDDITAWYAGIYCGGVNSALYNLYGVLCAFKFLMLDRHWKESGTFQLPFRCKIALTWNIASDAPLMKRLDDASDNLKEKVAELINWGEIEFKPAGVTYRS